MALAGAGVTPARPCRDCPFVAESRLKLPAWLAARLGHQVYEARIAHKCHMDERMRRTCVGSLFAIGGVTDARRTILRDFASFLYERLYKPRPRADNSQHGAGL